MRELDLNASESSPTSLVFQLGDESVFLAVTDDVRDRLVDALTTPTNTSSPAEHSATPSLIPSTPPAQPAAADDTHTLDDGAAATPAAPRETTASGRPLPSGSLFYGEDSPLTRKLRMTPREIQDRIRSGASIAELADENEVIESRIEPYAHPVLLERARIADMAKKAHPVRDDGPAALTLWEILATAFAARGVDMTTTTWDSYRDVTNQWVVTVSWDDAGARRTAEYSFLNHATSSSTAVARNSLATQLIDPQPAEPQRSLRAVASVPSSEPTPEQHPTEDTTLDMPPEDDFDSAEELSGDQPDTEFFRHPDTHQPTSHRRQRKARTPHWEDVLLGVRANTKRPRS